MRLLALFVGIAGMTAALGLEAGGGGSELNERAPQAAPLGVVGTGGAAAHYRGAPAYSLPLAHNASLAGTLQAEGDSRGGPGEEPDLSPEDLNAVIQRYCASVCHNSIRLRGNLSLEAFDVAQAPQMAETAEKAITKLRAGMMPPPGRRRPGGDTLLTLVETLERTMDEAAAANPNPGGRPFQRVNRAEYKRVIRDLLGLDVDPGEWLPLDSYLANFDNMANAQTLSPAVLEAYLAAANEVARLALGNPNAPFAPRTYDIPRSISQHAWDHIEGTPEGTRGGVAVDHNFLADAEYVFEALLWTGDVARFEDLDVSINGTRVALLPVEVLGGDADMGPGWIIRTDPVFVRAGQHRVAAAFIRKTEGLYDDVIRPHDWSLAGTREFVTYGHTLLPHLRSLSIIGPYNPTGVSETAGRRRIFTCRPTSPDQARPCAEEIVSRLATQAYGRVLTDRDFDGLMSFYDAGAAEAGFEIGIRTALEAILVSPHFIFRVERAPEGVRAGEAYQIGDMDLASRLSLFLWGRLPDDELVQIANAGRLSKDEVLEQQVGRMLEDPRSDALATRFAASWLRMQDMGKVQPDAFFYPNFTGQLRDDMRRETEIFFDHILREDRSLMELFNADYTFVNERLARHYGILGVVGESFRRVQYPDARRRGLLGQGSVQLLTSMGNRTSPVLRGKWVMEVLLGTPPPPPPPGVPPLEETEGVTDGRMLTTRQRMGKHRSNPTCLACHRFMDPIGLALDNFGVTGEWRTRENGMPLDTRGDFYDGTPISNLPELLGAMQKRPTLLLRNFTVNLMAYAVGRRVEYYDQPTIRAIVRGAEANGYKMSSFVLGVVKSPSFRMTTKSTVALGAGED